MHPRAVPVVSLLVIGVAFSGSLAANPEAAKTTTELGVTVTSTQVLDSMLEMDGFWPPVRNYIRGTRFNVGDPETRQEAVGLLKQLDEQMSERLFSEDVAVGQDLFDYVAARLRKYEFLRRLEGVVGDDATMIALKAEWDRALAEAYELPEAERAGRLAANVEAMEEAMRKAGLPGEMTQAAQPLWELLAESTLRVDATEAGKAAVAFECRIAADEGPAARLVCRIMEAAEWALIVKPEGEELSRRHFLEAWEALDRHAQPSSGAASGGGQ